jgi:hypothetical protein
MNVLCMPVDAMQCSAAPGGKGGVVLPNLKAKEERGRFLRVLQGGDSMG